MNPALHVAHYAMAGAAVRNNQLTGTVQQTTPECFMGTMPTWATILILSNFLIVFILLGIGIYYSRSSKDFENQYWSMRINQISKTLKK